MWKMCDRECVCLMSCLNTPMAVDGKRGSVRRPRSFFHRFGIHDSTLPSPAFLCHFVFVLVLYFIP